MAFAHLHVHTDGSLLDGMNRVPDAVQHAVADGQPALAITDHGTLFNLPEHAKACESAGIKAIFGIEAYLAPTDRTVRAKQSVAHTPLTESYTHMTLLARNNEGLKNLYRLSELSYSEGFYFNPRIDRELLSQFGKGLIATTGCLGGEVNQLFVNGFDKQAYEVAAEMRDIFGAENYFVEMMNHGIAIENAIHRKQIELARYLGVKTIASNDSHYTSEEDKHTHQAILCMGTKSTLNEPKFTFEGEGYHLRTSAEMREVFKENLEACDNTLLVAEMCEATIDFVPVQDSAIPHFPVPEGSTETEYFREQVELGLHKKVKDPTPEYIDRIKHEIGIIERMGYAGYFLVVSDYIGWARRQGIRVGPGRGSGAGSLVAYCLDITRVDPIRHNLLFERFLNPERVSLPDLDIDFDDERRDEVIAYIADRYGHDRVAQVVTFGTRGARVALRDAARVLGLPYAAGDTLSKGYPADKAGKSAKLAEVLDPNNPKWGEDGEDFRLLINDRDIKPWAQKVVPLAQSAEGMITQTGVHASAVIIGDAPLHHTVPLMTNKNGVVVTQYDFGWCEKLGLVKFDFLGLKNLRIITDALEKIKQVHGIDVDIDDIPLDDPKTFELVREGKTVATFQLEGDGMRQLLKRMQASSFDDISAVSALYRPGPMGMNSHTHYADRKIGVETDYDYIHPELNEVLKPILSNTYGVVVYQEQVMRISQTLADYTLGEADILRRVMGKKDEKALAQEKPKFEKAMLAKGYSRDAFNAVWDIILPFSDYAFNASHAYAYGLVAYQTCWLKANYPVEYMAAVLSSGDKVTPLYLEEARRMGIPVVAPDINVSGTHYTPTSKGTITYGLTSIADVGGGTAKAIVAERARGGEYTSLTNLFRRVPSIGKNAAEALAYSGAFDHLGLNRNTAVIYSTDSEFLSRCVQKSKNDNAGIRDLFEVAYGRDDKDPQSLAPELSKNVLLAHEKRVTGMYFSGHPYDKYRQYIERVSFYFKDNVKKPENRIVINSNSITDAVDADEFSMGGVITRVESRTSRRGNEYLSLTIADMEGEFTAQAFAGGYKSAGSELLAPDRRMVLKEGVIVQMIGSLWVRDDGNAIFRAEKLYRAIDEGGKQLYPPTHS